MADTRPTGTGLGMTYIFAKTFVHDLEAMASFYENVFGLVPYGRHQDEMLGRKIDEVTYQASYPGGPALTLIKFLDSTGPIAGEAVLRRFCASDRSAETADIGNFSLSSPFVSFQPKRIGNVTVKKTGRFP